jgi:hypothetical protein
VQCPLCVNALEFYLASCDGAAATITTSEYATYGSIMTYADRLASTGDCHAYFNTEARAYATSECSTAFDHVVWMQSGLGTSAVVAAGVMTVPYTCLAANATLCPAECQADLDLLAATCHNEDTIAWAGLGLANALTLAGAPAGTNLSSSEAWARFVDGTGAVPSNLAAGVSAATPLPLDLSFCTLPVDSGGYFPNFSPPPPVPPSPPPPSPPPPSPPPPSPPPPPPVRAAGFGCTATQGADARAAPDTQPPPPTPPPPGPPPPSPSPPPPARDNMQPP